MSVITLWLNKNLSSTFNVIETLRAARRAEQFRILCTHTNPDAIALRVADGFEVEPKGLSRSQYIDYCLDFIRRERVDVFFPGRNLRSIVRERGRFEALGTRLVAAADADTLGVLESKATLYGALTPALVPLPEFRVAQTLAEFDAAYGDLKERHRTICFKPCISLFGLGFRIVTESGSGLDRLLTGDSLKIGLDEVRGLLGQQARFRDLMVMEYLPGPERSVDCLAQGGALVRCVVRRKPSGEGAQWIEDNPAVEEAVRKLTAHFRLDGLFNVQFRDRDGVPYLLEINPRMSGGLHFACLSGVAFPYWAVRLALGTARPEDVPHPRTGLRVGQVNRGFLL
jgi:ATP-grasp in the biosynthetic pathway with Ter operon